MEKTRAFLVANRDSFEDYGYFDDHDVYYKIIEQEITPDNVIETCKSLVDAVCKTILGQIYLESNKTANRFEAGHFKGIQGCVSQISSGKENQLTTTKLFGFAVDVLFAYNPSLDHKGLKPLGQGVCTALTDLRNERGDVSHGKAAPKLIKTEQSLAELLSANVDHLMSVLLEYLAITNFSEDKEESSFSESAELAFAERPTIDDPLIESLRSFNQELDKKWQAIDSEEDKTRYSRALYDQYPTDYEAQFIEYCDQQQESN